VTGRRRPTGASLGPLADIHPRITDGMVRLAPRRAGARVCSRSPAGCPGRPTGISSRRSARRAGARPRRCGRHRARGRACAATLLQAASPSVRPRSRCRRARLAAGEVGGWSRRAAARDRRALGHHERGRGVLRRGVLARRPDPGRTRGAFEDATSTLRPRRRALGGRARAPPRAPCARWPRQGRPSARRAPPTALRTLRASATAPATSKAPAGPRRAVGSCGWSPADAQSGDRHRTVLSVRTVEPASPTSTTRSGPPAAARAAAASCARRRRRLSRHAGWAPAAREWVPPRMTAQPPDRTVAMQSRSTRRPPQEAPAGARRHVTTRKGQHVPTIAGPGSIEFQVDVAQARSIEGGTRVRARARASRRPLFKDARRACQSRIGATSQRPPAHRLDRRLGGR
jgi:hypothetical protein